MHCLPHPPWAGRGLRDLIVVAALCGPLLPAPAAAAAVPSRTAAAVTLNFPATDIDAVTRAMAAIQGRPIVLDPRVKGQLTLYSEQAMTAGQAWAMYLGGLRGLGYAVVDRDGLLTVLPEAEAKLQARTLTTGSAPGAAGDAVLTQVFRLQHENANTLVGVLRPLISANNTINVGVGSNALVITD